MIVIIAAAAGVAAVPIAGGLVYRKARQRKVAQALVINTPKRNRGGAVRADRWSRSMDPDPGRGPR
jgi:hypothetical protein